MKGHCGTALLCGCCGLVRGRKALARTSRTLHAAAAYASIRNASVLSVPPAAPVQATALLKAISEPLVSLEVGRLTRRLSSPTKLVPTEERGVLSLWLLPNDDLVLTWRAALAPQSAPAGSEPAPCGMAVWEALAHFPEHSFHNSEEPGTL